MKHCTDSNDAVTKNFEHDCSIEYAMQVVCVSKFACCQAIYIKRTECTACNVKLDEAGLLSSRPQTVVKSWLIHGQCYTEQCRSMQRHMQKAPARLQALVQIVCHSSSP